MGYIFPLLELADSVRSMYKDATNTEVRSKWIRWTARIWGALIIAFVVLFVIGSIHSLITTGESDPNAQENIPLIEYSGPILLFLSTVGLAIAWKREKIGGGIAVGFQLLFLIILPFQDPISLKMSFIGPLMISLFVMIPGLFFLAYWRRSVHSKITA
jgi:hypothetical protein